MSRCFEILCTELVFYLNNGSNFYPICYRKSILTYSAAMLPTSNTSDQPENLTSNNLEQGTTAGAAPARQDLDSSNDELPDELPEEFLHPGDVIGYYEGTFGDKYSYREAQITAVNTLEPITPMKLHNGYVITTGCMGKRIIKRTCINAADYRSNLFRDLDDFTLVNGCLHISAQLPSPASEFNSILHQNTGLQLVMHQT